MLALATSITTGLIFLFRGRDYKHIIWGDDAHLLFEHTIDQQSSRGRLHLIDPFGLLDSYNGNLVVITRITMNVLAFRDTGNFPLRAFWFSSLIWTIIATFVALIIGKFTYPLLGFMAALTLAIMPFSNLVMLAQVNTIYMPAMIALIITVVTRQYPKSRVLQLVTCTLFALLTLTSITSIVVFGYLTWLVYVQKFRVQKIERSLVWVTGIALSLQAISYQSRDRIPSPSTLIQEIRLLPNAFAPQFIREQILESKSLVENILLYGIPLLLGITVLILVRLGNQSERKVQVKIAEHLFLIALILPCMLLVGNGWLNSHYLFISTGLFWIGVILVFDAARHSASRLRFIPIAIIFFVFLTQLSGTYFVI